MTDTYIPSGLPWLRYVRTCFAVGRLGRKRRSWVGFMWMDGRMERESWVRWARCLS
jgi:hypothetical protein